MLLTIKKMQELFVLTILLKEEFSIIILFK